MNNKHVEDDLFLYWILGFIAIMIMPLGILIDICLFVPLAILFFSFKKSFELFMFVLFAIFISIIATAHFTDIFSYSFAEYKIMYLAFINDFLDPYLHYRLLKVVLALQDKAFNVAPLTALILPGFVIYKFDLWNKISFKNIGRKTKISNRRFQKLKNKSNDLLIGIDKNTKKPVYLLPKERGMHTHVLGATGFGKTESVLLPMIENDIRCGRGLLLFDAKADDKLLHTIQDIADSYNRKYDIKIFTPSVPEISDLYNPFVYTDPNATSMMNKIIGALEWSEPFYKKTCETVLQTIGKAFPACHEITDIHGLHEALLSPHKLLEKTYHDKDTKIEIEALCKDYKKYKEFVTGLVADLSHLRNSDIGALMHHRPNGIELFNDYGNQRIIIFQVSALQYPQTAKLFGRILLQDIMQLSSQIHVNVSKKNRQLFPVYIDEFASFAFPEFASFMGMSRESGLGITVLHQSLGDLEIIDPAFKKQIMSNTNTKIILKVNDADTIDDAARMTGTRERLIETYQTEHGLFNTNKRTGVGSETTGNEFNIHPRVFRKLKIGEAVVIVNSSNKLHHTALTRINPDNHTHTSLQNRYWYKITSNKKATIQRCHTKEKDTPRVSELLFGERSKKDELNK